MNVRIATFNCENLFARFRFRESFHPSEATKDGFSVNDLAFSLHDDVKRAIAAKVIKALAADAVALQEVENLKVLERFRNDYLGGFKAFPHLMVIEGNDPRYINVALLSRFPIAHARSYREVKVAPSSRSFVFSRDCLEADLDLGETRLTLFINHFKSMIGGRLQTRVRRLEQASTVKTLISDRFGAEPGTNPFIVLGDFNDYCLAGHESESGVAELVQWDQVEDVVKRLPAEQQWTHYFNGGDEYTQLDYVLVSRVLSRGVNIVAIERRGMPLRATRVQGPRFPGVGKDNPKASDHCPVVVELIL